MKRQLLFVQGGGARAAIRPARDRAIVAGRDHQLNNDLSIVAADIRAIVSREA